MDQSVQPGSAAPHQPVFDKPVLDKPVPDTAVGRAATRGKSTRRGALAVLAVTALLAGCSGSTTGPSATTLAAGSTAAGSSPAGPPNSAGSGLPATTTASSAGDAAGSSGQSSSAPGSASDSAAATAPVTGDLQVTTFATDLAGPWGLTFLPDGTAIVSGRDDASISAIAQDGTVTPVGTIEDVNHGGEGGLLGVAASPTFDQDNLLFVYYTAESDNRIATVTLENGALQNQQVLLTDIPNGSTHNGGRLVFGPDGLLYAGTGDSGQRANAQDLTSLGGKVLRLAPDGTPAPGNPFPESPYVYSTGHRNVQGLAFDESGRLWASEFGQNTWDELNLIVPGGNYGWPEIEGSGDQDGFIAPQREWPTDKASPSGIAVWRGAVWMAGLRGVRLWQIPITDSGSTPTESGASATGEPVAHLTGDYGRLRTAEVAPDGSLWVTTSNTDGRGNVRDGDDRILRIEPAS